MSKSVIRNNKWLILSILSLIGAVLLFLGGFFFFNRMKENYVRYMPDQITDKIISDMKYTDLVKIEKSQLSKHYDIPAGTLSDCSVYMSKSSESASELDCFLLSDQSKYDKLQAAVNAHISTKAAGFKSLNPTQYNQVKNFLIVHSGRYVLVAIGNNTALEEKTFRNMLS